MYRAYFPSPASRAASALLMLLVVVPLLIYPFTEGVGVFPIYHAAYGDYVSGRNPFKVQAGLDYFKYGIGFFLPPLNWLFNLPLKWSAFTWQLLSLVLYYGAAAMLLATVRPSHELSTFVAIALAFIMQHDLVINGQYFQANTMLIAIMMTALVCYLRHHFVISALLFAYASSIKLFPIVLPLLLVLIANTRFRIATLSAHILFFGIPFIALGVVGGMHYYENWLTVIAIDKNIVWESSKDVHHYLSLRAFLQTNFDIIMGAEYALIPLTFGLLIATRVIFLHYRGRVVQPITLFLIGLTYIMVFNTRTEGPSLANMAPVYGLILLSIHERDGAFRKWECTTLLLIFFLTSMSTSDIVSGTFIEHYSWQYNLRFIGLAALFALSLSRLKNSIARESNSLI